MKDKHSDILFQGSNDWIISQEQIIENKYTFKSAMFMNPHTEDLISKHEVIKMILVGRKSKYQREYTLKGSYHKCFYYLKMFQCPLIASVKVFVPKMSIWQLRRKVWLLKVTVCFHGTSSTSFISKDQGEFESSWYEPFNNDYGTAEPAVILIWFESKVLLKITAATSHHPKSLCQVCTHLLQAHEAQRSKKPIVMFSLSFCIHQYTDTAGDRDESKERNYASVMQIISTASWLFHFL